MTATATPTPSPAPARAPISMTDVAAERVRHLIEAGGDGVIGLRIGVKSTGCSGMSYVLDYAKEVKPHEEEVDIKGVKVLIDPSAIMFLIGTELDWKEDKLQSHFVFNNPNEKDRCGCGESFSV